MRDFLDRFCGAKYDVFGMWVPTHRFLPSNHARVEIMTSSGECLLAMCFNGVWYFPGPDSWLRSERDIISWKPRPEDDKRPAAPDTEWSN